MDVTNSTVLITGGSAGIGFALAKRFANSGSRVIVCGRRQEALDHAKQEIPSLECTRCDVASEDDRTRLFEQVTNQFPALNVLINNAGIQVRPPSWRGQVDWKEVRQELAINFEAPVHLCALFTPFLLEQPSASIVNVTSGLAFVPISMMPTYCATKAAMHSFTLSLRKQLEDTNVRVIEMAPPAVDTDLGGPGLHTFGVPLDEYADAAFEKLKAGDGEFGYGTAERARLAGREAIDEIFQQMNSRR